MTQVSKLSEKFVGLDEASRAIKAGDTVAVGGFRYYCRPMTLVRQIIAHGLSGLTLIDASGHLEAELLLRAQAVDRLIFSFVTLDIAGMAPAFRSAAEEGTVEMYEYGNMALLRSLQAAQQGLSHLPARSLIGSEILTRHQATAIEGSAGFVAAPALSPDIALLHAPWADTHGNVFLASEALDLEMAKAAKTTIVSVEQVVHPSEARRLPATAVHHRDVDFIVRVPFGAHPSSCFPLYAHDLEHIQLYAAEVRQGAADDYMDRYVRRPGNQMEYLNEIGVETLLNLQELMETGRRIVGDAPEWPSS